MNGYRWAPSDLGPALTRELPVQVVMARSPHRCPLFYGGSSADVIQLPDMAEWRFSRYNKPLGWLEKIVNLLLCHLKSAVVQVCNGNLHCHPRFSLNRSIFSRVLCIWAVSSLICTAARGCPLSRKSEETSNTLDRSNNKSIDMPRLPSSIFLICSTLMLSITASRSCVRWCSLRSFLMRSPN